MVSPPLPLVPLPRAVRASDGPGFRLATGDLIAGATTIDGTAASRVLVELLTIRTGMSFATPLNARIEARIERGGPPESYALHSAADGIILTAPDDAGLFYGAHTLTQLITSDDEGWYLPAVDIADAPRFSYRGVMLDVARHFFPVEVVKAYIDRASSLKFNHLHLHLTDDQGWRVHLESRPRLTEAGSATSVGGDPDSDPGGFYTKADYRDLVAYAATRHMTIVPEVDVPGHTHAVALAYPELAEPPVLSPEILDVVREYGGRAPTEGEPYTGMAVGFSSLKIHDEATYDFLADVFGELAAMTPGPFLHVGGDEALGTPAADFAEFMARATEIVADLGKTPIAWHEAGAASIAIDTVGQYWGFTTPTDGMDAKARAFVRNGSRLILSPADAAYLDMKEAEDSPLGLTWANGPTSVQRAYSWEPVGMIDGIGEDDVLGVEAPLWTETIRTLADIDRMAFPRIAAAAEVAWSSAPAANPERTWASFRERVGALGPLWTRAGIGFCASREIEWVRE